MASLLEAPCGLVDPGAQAAAAAPVAVFSVDASGSTSLMPFEGCDAGAVAGISRFFLVCAVDGATSIVEFDLVRNGVQAGDWHGSSLLSCSGGSRASSFVLCHG